jgi:UDPglucose 6-dehydrogenase
MNIGIIGQGFVGNAVYQKFKKYYNVLTFDLDASKSNSTKEEVMSCEIVFVCLPTPMAKDGTCHVGIVEDVLVELDEFAKTRIAIVKSTVAPGTTRKWNEKMKNLTVTFNPEFLTEANAVQDFENQTRIILGGVREATTELKPLFAKPFPNATIVKTDSTYAEMVKYVTNCFLATKVSFANEMYEICKGLEIDYDKVVEYARYDKRLGDSHWAVPGPDGDFGYGGHCFPKDVRALIEVAGSLNINPTMLFATDIKNNNVRNDRDWEDMEGRAVI